MKESLRESFELKGYWSIDESVLSDLSNAVAGTLFFTPQESKLELFGALTDDNTWDSNDGYIYGVLMNGVRVLIRRFSINNFSIHFPGIREQSFTVWDFYVGGTQTNWHNFQLPQFKVRVDMFEQWIDAKNFNPWDGDFIADADEALIMVRPEVGIYSEEVRWLGNRYQVELAAIGGLTYNMNKLESEFYVEFRIKPVDKPVMDIADTRGVLSFLNRFIILFEIIWRKSVYYQEVSIFNQENQFIKNYFTQAGIEEAGEVNAFNDFAPFSVLKDKLNKLLELSVSDSDPLITLINIYKESTEKGLAISTRYMVLFAGIENY